MEKSRQFNQEQKLVILESAKEVGIKEAPRIAGVHYTTVYEWRNRLEVLGRDGLFSRIKLQTPVWRCSGCPKGSSSLVAKDAPGSCRGSFTRKYFLTGIYPVDMETRCSFCCK